jgi:hypothetical protein
MDFKPNTTEPNFHNALTIAGNKHDMVGIRVYDPREVEIPPIGLIKLKDAETGQYNWVDTSSYAVRESYSKWWNDTEISLKQTFSRCKVDSVAIATNEDYVKPLIKLFKQRA